MGLIIIISPHDEIIDLIVSLTNVIQVLLLTTKNFNVQTAMCIINDY